MQLYFDTLNAALVSEGLLDSWPIYASLTVPYGATVALAHNGRHISVYRDDRGRYERPVHYATLMADTAPRLLAMA